MSHNARTRRLREDEPIPTGEPRRYLTTTGYRVLSWLVDGNYFQIAEHRLVAGRPASHLIVHHINGNKLDNRPENLQVMTQSEHAKLNVTFDVTAAARDYAEGMSYTALSRKYGIGQVAIMRALKTRGHKSRPSTIGVTHCKQGHALDAENTMIYVSQNRLRRRCKICSRASCRRYAAKRRAA